MGLRIQRFPPVDLPVDWLDWIKLCVCYSHVVSGARLLLGQPTKWYKETITVKMIYENKFKSFSDNFSFISIPSAILQHLLKRSISLKWVQNHHLDEFRKKYQITFKISSSTCFGSSTSTWVLDTNTWKQIQTCIAQSLSTKFQMEHYEQKRIENLRPLAIFAKSSILDV